MLVNYKSNKHSDIKVTEFIECILEKYVLKKLHRNRINGFISFRAKWTVQRNLKKYLSSFLHFSNSGTESTVSE